MSRVFAENEGYYAKKLKFMIFLRGISNLGIYNLFLIWEFFWENKKYLLNTKVGKVISICIYKLRNCQTTSTD